MKIIRTTLAAPIEHEDGNHYVLTNADNREFIAAFVFLNAAGTKREKGTPDDSEWGKVFTPRLSKEIFRGMRYRDETPEAYKLRKDVLDICLDLSALTGSLHLPPEEMFGAAFMADLSKALTKSLQWPNARRYCMKYWNRRGVEWTSSEDREVATRDDGKMLCELGAEKIAEILNAIERTNRTAKAWKSDLTRWNFSLQAKRGKPTKKT